MKYGVLGTGSVAQTIASKLIELGHHVMMGSRTAQNEKAVKWISERHLMLRSYELFDMSQIIPVCGHNCTLLFWKPANTSYLCIVKRHKQDI